MHISETQSNISPIISSFSLTVVLWEIYRFHPPNLTLIPIMHIKRINCWSRNNYFWKVLIPHLIRNHWKKLAPLWALQFQFNCETYPIRKLPSLKLHKDSQCTQASSSTKNIYVPNVRRDFHIYIARQSAALTKNLK